MKKLKKHRTLEDDLRRFLLAQVYMHHIEKHDVKGLYRIPGLGIKEPKIFKATRFSCQSLGGGSYSGIRVIYAYSEKENDRDKVTLIEIYYKGDKENENRDRIIKYFG
ncbi:hypothetical protein JW879_08135 [candidate division WOR-3 bacterium]|nr:hypothetical protein [candidate division WOR-3 bacterium]